MKLRDIRKQLADFRAMDAGRLAEQLTNLKKEQFNLRFQQATGQLESTARIGVVRDQIARVMTVLREKQPAKNV